MKNRFLSLAIILTCFVVSGCGILGGGAPNSQVQYSQYIGKYWGQWKTFDDWAFQGRPNSFVVYSRDSHPSNYCFKLTINNFFTNYLSKGEERRFSGTIEYTSGVNDNDASRVGYFSRWFVENDLPYLSHHYYTKTRPANFIVERKGNLYYYNVFFDDVGFAITIPWKD